MRLTDNPRIKLPRRGLAWCFTLLLVSTPSSFVQAQDFTILPIARSGLDPSPNDGLFNSVSTLSINDKGQIAFGALTGVWVSGLFLFEQGEIFGIARQGDPDPDDGAFGLFGFVSLNQQGQMAVSAVLTTGEEGVYLFDGNTRIRIARSGDPAAGCGSFSSLVSPALNNREQMAFIGRVPAGYGTFFYDGSQILGIACPGDPAPGGGTFVRALWPSVNDNGQVVFEASVSSPVGGTGIFLYEKGEVRSIVRSGDPAPGGGTFGSLYRPLINNTGQVAFLAYGSGGGLWLGDGNQFRRILPYSDAKTGDEVAIMGPSLRYPHPFYLNDSGEIVFEGRRRASAKEEFRDGLFFFNGKRFQNVAFSGDPMPDPRGYRFRGFAPLSLNNTSQVVFVAGGYLRPEDSGLFLAIPDSYFEANPLTEYRQSQDDCSNVVNKP